MTMLQMKKRPVRNPTRLALFGSVDRFLLSIKNSHEGGMRSRLRQAGKDRNPG